MVIFIILFSNNYVWNFLCTVYLTLFINYIYLGISLGGLIGGFFYEKFGGVSTFKLFSTGSLFMGILHVLFIAFSKKNVNGIDTINWNDFYLC